MFKIYRPYPSFLQLFITLDRPPRDIHYVHLFLAFEALFLVNDASYDFELRPDDEYDLVAGRGDGLSRRQLDDVRHARWLPAHHEGQLLQQAVVEVHRFVSLDRVEVLQERRLEVGTQQSEV